MSTVKLNNLQDLTGSNNTTPNEIRNGIAKAWVNFDGTGTVAIRAAYNVSSITDNGTGLYTVNFASVMPDAEYAVTIAGRKSNSTDNGNFASTYGNTTRLPTTTSCPITTAFASSATTTDFPSVSVIIFH